MFVSINWIKEYVDLEGLDIKKLINSFTLATAEVEDIIVKGEDLRDVVEYLNNWADIIVVRHKDINVIVVQETSGEKVVFYDNDNPLFNYYNIEIFGDNIHSEKDTSVIIGNLIGKSILHTYKSQTWQLIFKQIANPRTVEYMDIRRIAYTCTMKLIVNRVR